jgi:hypothetical protein
LKQVIKTSVTDTYDFEVEGKKELERDYNTIHEDISRVWLPRSLPDEHEEKDIPIAATKYTMPVTIKITQSKIGRKNFQKQRVLVAILRLFQSVQPETYISPLIDDGTAKDLVIPEEVPLDDRLFRKYMDKATTGSRTMFAAKFVIKSNYMLHQFKYQELVIDYLREENMNIEINNLDCILPVPVGFFENLIARNETIDLYAKRLFDILPKGAPHFQLNVQSIKARHDRTRVLLLSCKPNDVIIMQEIMKSLHKENRVEFLTWKLWTNMVDEKKQTIILSQNKYTGECRSHVLSGFIDEDRDIPMVIEDKNNPDGSTRKLEKLETTSVNDYLLEIKSGDGTNLFEFVYPTTLGTKEFIVAWHHNEEAKDFLELGIGELARQMNEKSRNLVFEDPDRAFIDSCGPAWEPYYRIKDIESTVKHNFKNKRSRIEADERTTTAEIVAIQKMSNADITTPTQAKENYTIRTVPVIEHAQAKTPVTNSFSKNNAIPSPGTCSTMNTKTTDMSSMTTNNEIDLVKQMRAEMDELQNEIRNKPQITMELIDSKLENQGNRLRAELTTELTKKIVEESKETNKVFVECFKELRTEIEVDKLAKQKTQNDVNMNLQMILSLLGKTSISQKQDNSQQDTNMMEVHGKEDYSTNGTMLRPTEDYEMTHK